MIISILFSLISAFLLIRLAPDEFIDFFKFDDGDEDV